MEVFLKRAERPFKAKIGDEKAVDILDKIKKSANEIPIKFRRTIGSEIPKYLFNFSQDIEDISPGIVEGVLKHVLIFSESLKDLKGRDRNQVTQLLNKRSDNKLRGLSELLDAFVDKAKQGAILESQVNFDELLTFLVGGEEEVEKFSENELFIKRAKQSFAAKVGDTKADAYFEKIAESINSINEEFAADYVDSEISKLLFKLSQNIDDLSENKLDGIMSHTILFAISLADLGGKTKDQINQVVIRRSKNKLRNAFDLYKHLIDNVKDGNFMESCDSLEDIMTFLFGEEEVRQQFTDVEAFLKRAEKKYSIILGEDMIQMLMEELLDAISEIPEEHREYLGSDLAKYMFKASETATRHDGEKIELMYNVAIMYAYSLKEIGDQTKAEINQFIINRSKHEVRGLLDLYQAFLDKCTIRLPLANEPTFDEILNHTLGRDSGPQEFDQGGLVHEILADLKDEIPLVKEHASWGDAIMIIVPRYLEILPSGKGDRILDQMWMQKYPQDKIIEELREKIIEIPREHEKKFLFSMLHFLTKPVLEDKKDDKALTAAIAYRILGGMIIDMFSGRNAQIRGIRLTRLMKDRKIANDEHKKEIDHDILRILEEDLNSLIQKVMTINTIVPVINKKGFYIKIYDIVTKDMPKPVLKLITERKEERIKDIGQEYKKESVSGELIPLVNFLLTAFEIPKGFYMKYFEEMYSISMDAQQNMLALRKVFKFLMELGDNIDAIDFFEFKIANTEHIVYINILKYLYNGFSDPSISDVMEITRMIMSAQDYLKRVIKLDAFLSNQKLRELKDEITHTKEKITEYENMEEFDATQKIINLNKALQRDTNEVKFYDTMFKLIEEAEKADVVLQSRLSFSKKLLRYSNSLKKIHPNLPAALPDYMENIEEFGTEIDKIIEELKKKSETGIISPFEMKERNDAAIDAKKILSELTSNEKFGEHMKTMLEISKIVLFD